jgi:hypothetical protein
MPLKSSISRKMSEAFEEKRAGRLFLRSRRPRVEIARHFFLERQTAAFTTGGGREIYQPALRAH